MLLLILFLLKSSKNILEIFPILAVYTFAGYRIIPSVQQIYSSLTQLRFSGPAINKLVNEYVNLGHIKPKQVNKLQTLDLKKSIDLNNVSFIYPNSEKTSLNNVNIKFEAFQKIGIVGLTGSGKTTIIDLILGLLEPTQGTIEVDGKIICSDNKRIWQNKIGYVPQQIYLSDDTIKKNIAFGVDEENINYARVQKVAEVANLHDFIIKDLPKKYETCIGERGVRLSGGQKQRIGIARALYHDPSVLILDEATSALDSLTENTVMQAIKNLDKDITIILISHRLSIIKEFDKIFLISKGKVVDSGTFEMLEKNNNFFQNLKN
jgi:ABC-type multidrug transport system fused ATPase/permease subunit